MKKDKYQWRDGNIPKIEVHSLKKHEVLREYLLQYIRILGRGHYAQKELTVTLIDGFAGGGLYQYNNGLHEGSPLIFLQATKEAEDELSREHQFTLKAHYIFVEKEKQYLAFLDHTLKQKGFESRIGNDIFLWHGIFEEQIDNIVAHIKKRGGKSWRCIFLLDQYGYSDVTLWTIKKIFSQLPNAEIILTFSIDLLITYMMDTPEYQNRLKQLGFSLDVTNLAEEKTQQKWRFDIQHKLERDFRECAKYYTNFFIKSRESQIAYWFLHLSTHIKARDVMQTLHWNKANSFIHEGKPGLNMLSMLGYKAKSVGQPFLFSDYDQSVNHTTLLEEIPPLIHDYRCGIQVENFLNQNCNHTPSTCDMLKEACKELYQTNEIEIKTPTGKDKQKGAKIQNTDIIYPKRQLIFHC